MDFNDTDRIAFPGIFCVLFIGTMHVLVVNPRNQKSASGRLMPGQITNKFLFSVSITLFVLITVVSTV